MSFVKRILSDIHVADPIYCLGGAVVMAALGFVTLLSSDCHPMYRILLLPRGALPYFAFAMLSIALLALIGLAGGLLFALPGCRQRGWSVLLLLVALAILVFAWFHVLFRQMALFWALLIMIAILALEVFVIIKTYLEYVLSCMAAILSLLISLHLCWLNLGLWFLN